jgi:hypothetical protein
MQLMHLATASGQTEYIRGAAETVETCAGPEDAALSYHPPDTYGGLWGVERPRQRNRHGAA